MKIIQSLSLISLLSLASFAAQAEFIDFNAMAESSGSHGESAWNELNLTYSGFSVSITGTKDAKAAYAYLDANNAGLGVCGNVYDTTKANKITNSGSNLCNPSSDDNVTTGESIFLTFNTDVIIDFLWFNNNHDSDHSLLNDSINIGGSAFQFNNGGYNQKSVTSGSYLVAANTKFEIAYLNEAFYLDAMEVRFVAVPESTSLLLLLVGLLGLISYRRRIV